MGGASGARFAVEVCEIFFHVIHRFEELLCVAVCAECSLGIPAFIGRAFPYFVGELEVADAQELLGVGSTIVNRLPQLPLDDVEVVPLGPILTDLCEEQRLVKLIIRQLHVALAGTLRVMKQVRGDIKGVWRQEEPALQIACVIATQSLQQGSKEAPCRIPPTIRGEIDWMGDKRHTEAGKLVLLNAYPIFRKLHALIDGKTVKARFVSHDDASNRRVIIGAIVLFAVAERSD